MGINERLRKLSSVSVFAVLFFSALLSGCDPEVEGCLDFRALDVDVGADEDCEDCCNFPSLQLQFVPVRINTSDTVVLRSTDTLFTGITTGTLPELGFYLHDIFLIADDGERIEMLDTFTVFADSTDPNFLFESSVLRVTPFRQTSYSLGTLLEAKTFVAIEARLGLPDVLSTATLNLQPSSSPLSPSTDSVLISIDSSYLDVAFKYEKFDGIRDSFSLSGVSDQQIRWDLPVQLDYQPSYNTLITLGLPVDNLLAFNNGTVNGTLFVNQFLEEASVLELGLSR